MTALVCGTGNWNGPKPGDPDTSNLILTATPAFGGVDLNWTYPLVNPHAVTYTIVYRSLLAEPDTKQFLVNWGSNFYYDKTDVSSATVYYYWIQMVSINGTVGELIGPAWAQARPLIADLMEELTGQIDAGLLAQSLKAGIDQLVTLDMAITKEGTDRLAADGLLGSIFNTIQADQTGLRTLVQQETSARTTANQAFVSSMNLLVASVGQNAAGIMQLSEAIVSNEAALAKSLLDVQAQIGTSIAGALTAYETAVDAQSARSTLKNTIQAAYQGYVATVLNDYVTVASSAGALASMKTGIQSDYKSAIASALLSYETSTTAQQARSTLSSTIQAAYQGYVATALQAYQTSADTNSALSTMQTTVQSSFQKQLASVQTTFTTQVATVNGVVTQLGALYTAKVDVNGLIGGFGVYNNGTFVEAGFDVDRFWVGRTTNKVKPFIIENDEVFINEARINHLTFSKLRDESGSLIVQNGKVQAQYIDASNLVVKSAAEFTGTIPTGQVSGLGSLASLDAYSYAALTGVKPPSNADVTGQNTSADTRKVAGTAASTVASGAAAGQAAAGIVNDWVRPGTTLIYGNKIYTGDAYVDTLQIKGNAVTVPNFAQSYNQVTYADWTTVIDIWVSLDNPGWLFASSTGYISYGLGWGDTSSALLINGSTVSIGGGEEAWVNACHSGALYVPAGVAHIELRFKSPSGKGHINQRSLFAMVVKR